MVVVCSLGLLFSFWMFLQQLLKTFILRHTLPRPLHTTQSATAWKQTLPYIKGVSEIGTRIPHPLEITGVHKPTSTLLQELSRAKDKVQKKENSNINYKIKCNNCNQFCVGQTGWQLCTRIHEHQLAICRHNHKSPISTHINIE